MAIRKKTVGTGITAREVSVYSGVEDMKQGLMQQTSRYHAKLARGKGHYGMVTADMEDELAAILAKAGPEPFEDDSKEDFAKRILDNHERVLQQIEAGNADQAARIAVLVGHLYSEAAMKFTFESKVIHVNNMKAKNAEANAAISAKHWAENEEILNRYNEIAERTPRTDKRKIQKKVLDELLNELSKIDVKYRNVTTDSLGRTIRRHKERRADLKNKLDRP